MHFLIMRMVIIMVVLGFMICINFSVTFNLSLSVSITFTLPINWCAGTIQCLLADSLCSVQRLEAQA